MTGSVVSAINRTIPISQFNRGLAGKIFDDVKRSGAKVVMKNNEAEVVLVPPEEYIEMMERLEDIELLSIALERLEHYDPSTAIPGDEVFAKLGITDEERNAVGEVEFE